MLPQPVLPQAIPTFFFSASVGALRGFPRCTTILPPRSLSILSWGMFSLISDIGRGRREGVHASEGSLFALKFPDAPGPGLRGVGTHPPVKGSYNVCLCSSPSFHALLSSRANFRLNPSRTRLGRRRTWLTAWLTRVQCPIDGRRPSRRNDTVVFRLSHHSSTCFSGAPRAIASSSSKPIQSLHQRPLRRLQQQVVVVGHQHAGMNPPTGLLAGFPQGLEKPLAVGIIRIDPLAVAAPGHYVIDRTRHSIRKGRAIRPASNRNAQGSSIGKCRYYRTPLCGT